MPFLAAVFISFALLTCHANATRFEFVAKREADIALGYFEWSRESPVFAHVGGDADTGKTLWEIKGGISLNSPTVLPMSSVVLEVINNWYIDAPIPNSLVGDQITLFGTAALGSGLQTVQNFYFRDESGLLLNSIRQPEAYEDFSQFSDVRVDLFRFGQVVPETFVLTEWRVVRQIPVPGTLALLLPGLCFAVVGRLVSRARRSQFMN